MKKILIVLCVMIFIFTGCSNRNENIIFKGEIESVLENTIIITTSDEVGFDRASVSYDKNMKLNFVPAVGQKVEVEILREIRESYPVQVTAVGIELNSEDIDKSTKSEYKKITAEDAKALIDSENVIIVDVRTQSEYDDRHIENAIILPVSEIENKAEEMITNKSAKLLVYCRSGNRSAAASQTLLEMGYTNVYDFGGIIDWPYELVK